MQTSPKNGGMVDMTEHWSVAQWQVDPPFVEGLGNVHTPLCGDHHRVVVGVDDSDKSVAALQWAGREAQLHGTHLHVVHAWEPPGTQNPIKHEQRQQRARSLVEQALAKAFPQFPVQVESLTVESRAAEVLVAASYGAALLVVGSHEHGAFGKVFNSVARRAVAFATCPVAVVRGKQNERPRSGIVAVGIDDSFTSREALRWAANEALYRGAELKVIHVAALLPGTMPWDLSYEIGQMMGYMLGEILVGPLAGVRASIYRDSADFLAGEAAGADLLVVGSHGYGSASGALIGSITSDCIDAADCPVVVIPDTREDQRNRVRNAKLAMERGPAPTLYPPGITDMPRHPDMTTPTDHAGLEIMPSDACLRLLASVPVGRVSFYADGEVVVLPVNHVVEGQDVVFRTARGSKLSAVERRNPIAFEADGYDPQTQSGWSVLVNGHAELVRNDAEIQRLSSLGLDPTEARPFWIRIRPHSVTGRRTAPV